MKLGQIATRFGCELVGDPDVDISSVATLAGAGTGAISFYANTAYADSLRNTTASAVVLKAADLELCPASALLHDNPYLLYARIADVLYPDPEFVPGVHALAVVASSATVDPGARIEAHAVIEEEANVAAGASVGPGAVVGRRCSIGEGTRLLANVTLVQDVHIGKRCIVHPGAVIGSDGFGNAMSESGWVKVKQVGGVRIGDDVEIGSNTTIDRGAIGDTEIEDGVRLDNLVMIAHNVRVGAHTAMAGMTGIAGSTTIGRRCLFAGQSGTVGHIDVCDDVVVGAKSYLSKDVTEPGVYSGSFPAEKDKTWKQKAARFRRIDDMFRRIGKLEKLRDV